MNGLEAEGFADYFMVIEMVLNTLHILIVLMTLTCYENDIARLSHHTGCADGFAPIHNTDYLAHICGRKASKHIIDNVLRFFEAGIV